MLFGLARLCFPYSWAAGLLLLAWHKLDCDLLSAIGPGETFQRAKKSLKMSRKAKNDFALIILVGVVGIVVSVVSFIVTVLSTIGSAMYSNIMPLSIIAAAIVALAIIYFLYVSLYFKGKKFAGIKNSISGFISNCNELNHHIAELKGSYTCIKPYDFGSSSIKDESNFKFKRVEWSKSVKNNFVHNCSAAVCKNANDQPLKYLCKYFDIETSEKSLQNIEIVLNDFSAAEQGKTLLQNERDSILSDIDSSIPWVIKSFNRSRLVRELGFEEIDLSDLYFPTYTFQYVSAGGNSSLSCDIKLDIENLNKLVSYLSGLIKFRNSVAGQRALMTSSLREKIKGRDNHTCQSCGLSTRDERNLLLEIDHITPLSKGGITTEANLQTLCWRCNRSKGSKILSAQGFSSN